MTQPPPPPNKRTRASARLVSHDIRLQPESRPEGKPRVRALVSCERRKCELEVDVCASCSRFARVETHEAGYVLLCNSSDVPSEAPDAAPTDDASRADDDESG
jgi:hypothetical protein